MGKRGPIAGATFGQPRGRPSNTAKKSPTKRATKALEVLPGITPNVPPVPEHLGVVGGAIWNDLWQGLPILSPRIDGSSVLRYCEVSEDAVRARAEINAHGLLIDEVVGDARGGILGNRRVLNPAEASLRRCDRVLTELSRDLGLTPASRARLGLTISLAELASAEANRVLSGMFTPVDAVATERKR